jgi:hypothetical protein
VQELIDDGFFGGQQTINSVTSELASRGRHIPKTSLSGPLQEFVKARVLRRQSIAGEGGKPVYHYSNY